MDKIFTSNNFKNMLHGNNYIPITEEAYLALPEIEYVFKTRIISSRIDEIARSETESYIIIPEWRVGQSKADIAIICEEYGIIIEEIKSDFDNLSKLDKQLTDYRKIANGIYIHHGNKTAQQMRDNYIEHSYNIKVGKVIRDKDDMIFEEDFMLNLFNTLRLSEVIKILELNGIDIAHMKEYGSIQLWNTAKKFFIKMNPKKVYFEYMYRVMAQTRGLNVMTYKSFIYKLPYWVRVLALEVRMTKKEQNTLLDIYGLV